MSRKARGELRGVVLRVVVIPEARRERVSRLANGWVRVYLAVSLRAFVASPAERDRANGGLVRLLAQTLGVPEEAVEILTGVGHAHKLVRVAGVNRRNVAARIKRLAPGHYYARRSVRRRTGRPPRGNAVRRLPGQETALGGVRRRAKATRAGVRG